MTVLLRRILSLGLVVAAATSACSSIDDEGNDSFGETGAVETGGIDADPGDCITVDMAVSPEKITLLTELAAEFNDSAEAQVGDRCVFVRPQRKSSGGAMQALAEGWDEAAEGPRPVVWSPAASTWGAVLNQRLDADGETAMTGEGRPFMLTPLVIAMPQPMAEALGWPETDIGWADILELARNDAGWEAYDHPEWGPFRLGKTNPNFSTSGLSALIAQTYAAAGKTSDLSSEDLRDPAAISYARDIESAVVHYGDTTLTFLNNWYRADQRGTALTYTSAAAVEEKSVIDYNLGNPDGVLDAGEEARPPRIPLVAIYPAEGTLFSDNPFFVLDAEWVDGDERAGAALFEEFVQQPSNQEKVLTFGFRPGNTSVPLADPLTEDNGVDVSQPETLLEVPAPQIMTELLDQWDQNRKTARVMLLMDVSGSMGDYASRDSFETKLDLAKRAAIRALDQFKDDDLVSLRVFSTDLIADGSSIELVPFGRIGDTRSELAARIDELVPVAGTPLYDATREAYQTMVETYDAELINAVVLLSDGQNDDGNFGDDEQQLDATIEELQGGSEGQLSRPVRVFPIAYGADADLATLRLLAEATTAAVYDASDPASIDRVFTQVISNF